MHKRVSFDVCGVWDLSGRRTEGWMTLGVLIFFFFIFFVKCYCGCLYAVV